MKKLILVLLLLTTVTQSEIRKSDNIYNIVREDSLSKEGYTFNKDYQIISKRDKSILTFCNLTESDLFQFLTINNASVDSNTGCLVAEKIGLLSPVIIIKELEGVMYGKKYVTYYKR